MINNNCITIELMIFVNTGDCSTSSLVRLFRTTPNATNEGNADTINKPITKIIISTGFSLIIKTKYKTNFTILKV